MMNTTVPIQLRPGVQWAEFDTSTKVKSYRVELPTGHHFQIDSHLAVLLECLRDKPATLDELSLMAGQYMGCSISPDDLVGVAIKLEDFGIVLRQGEMEASSFSHNLQHKSLLSLQWSRDVIPASIMSPFADSLRILFTLPFAVSLLGISMMLHVWVYAAPKDVSAISWPLLFLIMTLSTFIHEIGHLTACRFWDCEHGPLGIALYFFTPAFYVNVTKAYNLNRWQRAVIDIGGMYFQLITLPVLAGLYFWTENETYLFAIIMTDLFIIDNLVPFMKLDGYWLLSDLAGIPNLHTRTGDALLRLYHWLQWKIGWRAELPKVSHFNQLLPMAQAMVFCYAAVSVIVWPVLIIIFVPYLIEAITQYPSLWQKALLATGYAFSSGNWALLLPQLEALFLPTVLVINLVMFIKIMWNRHQSPKNQNKSEL